MLETFVLCCLAFVLGLEVSWFMTRRRTPAEIEALGHWLDTWTRQLDDHKKFVGDMEAVNVIFFTHRDTRYEMVLRKAAEEVE